MRNPMASMTLCLLLAVSVAAAADAPNAATIVRAAWDNWRGVSSYSEITMTIHRPDWERRMSMRVWTQGQSRSLVRVTAPAKDAGNATLLIDNSMWTYSPKVNRIIKIPSSMMNQNWMGSDFSNKDVARSDDILDQYDHELVKIREHDGLKVYVIDAIPHEEAAVVWGKERLHIREDFVILIEDFYDQDGVLVKGLKTLEIAELGGRTIASRQRMQKVEAPGEWTEIEVHDAEYDIDVDAEVFTRANLRNPRA